MKFLLLVKNLRLGHQFEDPIAVLKAAREHITVEREEGRLEALYQFANGHQAVAIVNADTAETAWERLTDYPLYSVQEYEIHPLVDVDFVFNKDIERLQKMAAK